jgi:acetyl-CoA synthetase
MFMRHGEDYLQKHDFSILELLGSVGEPINPEAWLWYYNNIGRQHCPIVDVLFQTETGGFMISAAPGIEPIPLKPGSATLPLPGVDAAVVDAQGKELPPNQTGFLVVKKPWPGMLLDIYGDPQRYREAYWSRIPGVYFSGDYAMRDSDGYFWLLGRADEVIKVAGHRLGTAEIESAVISHPAVTEVAATSKPDEVKGEVIVLFATLKKGQAASTQFKKEIVDHIRGAIGPIATPGEIFFVPSLPKTRSGKIMRRLLKAVATGQTIGDTTTLDDETSVDEARKAYWKLKGKT